MITKILFLRVASTLLVILATAVTHGQCLSAGMLYPRESESREAKDLSGMWYFMADSSPTRDQGFKENWFSKPLRTFGNVISMPVPSSYNDVTQDKSLRDFVGWVWYERDFFISSDWAKKRVVFRVDSAHYNSVVWINSKKVMEHSGGHLPFEAEVNQFVNFTGVNRVTIAVNNTLTPTTLPPGTIEYPTDRNRYPPGYFVQNLQMDFFNYAGIQRPVRVYATPASYISDITLKTQISGVDGIVYYNITCHHTGKSPSLLLSIIDKQGIVVSHAVVKAISSPSGTVGYWSFTGTMNVSTAHLWWPYTMNETDTAYLYTFQVVMEAESTGDVYRQPFGIREVKVTNEGKSQFLINNRPFYCHGVAKHEDSDIRGKGLDLPLVARDFSLLKWLGANCFRTSHYPYAEEILDQADQQGIVVIDESPGVGIKANNFGPESLTHHLQVMDEMYRRDKNRPAVVMWSVANEPQSTLQAADDYFNAVISHVKSLDNTRPVTFVTGPGDFFSDKAAQYVDVLCINRYYGWYSNTGHTELIQQQITYDFNKWYDTFNKPIMITEYGADTVAGLHQSPSFVFTEEFQVDFLREYHAAFDKMRETFLVGEMIWNFADFATVQGVTRVVGNKKGVFTRQRQPKMAAHLLRERYQNLIKKELNNGLYLLEHFFDNEISVIVEP